VYRVDDNVLERALPKDGIAILLLGVASLWWPFLVDLA